MKYLLRSFVFSYLSLFATQRVIGGFDFQGDYVFVLLIVLFSLTFLNVLMLPIFKLISLPEKGPAFLFLSFIMTLITMHILTVVIPLFKILPTTVTQLNILGFVLPSRNLTQFWSAVFSALLFSLVYVFFTWLCKGKGKRK